VSDAVDRVPAILADLARFAASADRVVRRRLPESYRAEHPDVDWRGIRAVRNFIAHDYDGTDDEILWVAISVELPRIVAALGVFAD
jgi:uncharacterized protein with HEPN domain